MLIPIVGDIEADPILAPLLILMALPIIGFFALLIPFIPLFILYTYLRNVYKKTKKERLRIAASKITYRRETLRGNYYYGERK